MSYVTRKALFEQIENLRERPLISYVTSIRPNLSGQMAGDSIDHIIEQIQQIPSDKREIDFLQVKQYITSFLLSCAFLYQSRILSFR